jgi:hypothetical protein
MKGLLLAAALFGVSLSAQAIPFAGTYSVNVNSSDPGLRVTATPTAGNLGFNLNVGESTPWTFLFSISTPESTVNGDDLIPVDASIDFSFSLPIVFGGTSSGETVGVSLYSGLLQAGVLKWDNGGLNTLHFGNGGALDVYLEDAVFGFGLFGLSDYAAAVNGKFKYVSAPTTRALAVPEPAILTLLGAGLLVLAWLRRRQSAPHRNDHK